MAVIRMLKAYGSNVTGEVCGQPDDVASLLVDRGFALYVTAAPVSAVTKEMEAVTKEEQVFVEAEDEVLKSKAKRKKG